MIIAISVNKKLLCKVKLQQLSKNLMLRLHSLIKSKGWNKKYKTFIIHNNKKNKYKCIKNIVI